MSVDLTAGLLAQANETLETIARRLTRGGVDHFEQEAWPAGGTAEYSHNGTFEGVAIINASDADAFVGLSPNTAKQGTALFTLRAREWIVLPVRGSYVSLGGPTAGAAVVVPLGEATPFAAGNLGGGTMTAVTIGDALSGAADTGSAPVKVGGRFNTVRPTVADGQRVEQQMSSHGASLAQLFDDASNAVIAATNPGTDGMGSGSSCLRVIAHGYAFTGAAWDRARSANVFKPIAAVAVVAGTPVTVWTPAAGKKFRLMGFMLSLSVAGSVLLLDNAGGAEIVRTPLMAAGAGLASPPLGNGALSAVANNVLKVDVTANGNVSGFVFGTEE